MTSGSTLLFVAVDAFQYCFLAFKAFAWASVLGGAGASFFAFGSIFMKGYLFHNLSRSVPDSQFAPPLHSSSLISTSLSSESMSLFCLVNQFICINFLGSVCK